jgi:hypothetical protein
MKIYKSQNWLLALLIVNLVSTLVHYTHNFIFFNSYPAPNWMNMHHICIAWLILTPFAIVGYFLYAKHKYWLAYLCLFVYSNAGAASMGHYFYGSINSMSIRMNLSIMSDVIAGIALDLFLFWSAFVAQEWVECDK